MVINIAVVLITVVGISSAKLREPRPDEGAEYVDRKLDPLDIIRKYGYPAENHTVTTEDGYILTLHRIPYGRLCSKEESKGPVILQHGLFCSSADWIITGTKRGLAYVLADSCYDVWMPNSRGTTLSRAHKTLKTNSREYWDFSWHEMGIYDTPACIDYILNETKAKDLLYVGHSQGTTSFFVFNSMKPEYKDKVRAGFLMAPIAFLERSQSYLLQIISHQEQLIGWGINNIANGEFMPRSWIVNDVGGAVCRNTQPLTPMICENLLFIACGFDSKQLNDTMLSIIMGHTPAGVSSKQMQHYAQGFNFDDFRLFDYGSYNNRLKYGRSTPPSYNLSAVDIPTVLFHSKNDLLADLRDVDKLIDRLGNVKESILIPYKYFNHVDYMFATDALPMLYEPLVEEMDKY